MNQQQTGSIARPAGETSSPDTAKKKARFSIKTAPAWALLVAGLLATAFISQHVKKDSEQHATRQFSLVCDQITFKIRERLNAYALILRGGAGLFAATGSVDRHGWKSFVETLRAQGSVPGVQGIGFSELVAPDQLFAHIAAIRSEGFPEYTVRPAGERAIYTSIIYLEPFQARNLRAFGFDMFSEPVRRAAMERARDTGEAALSDKVELVQETGTEVQAGALMYVPVYRNGTPVDNVAQRREALLGWVYSPYRMNDLMGGILGNLAQNEGINLHVYDGSEASPACLLFENQSPQTVLHSPLSQHRTLDFGGNLWLLAFEPASSPLSDTAAWATLGGGFVLSGLLCGLLLSVINTQEKAALIASQLTREVRASERNFRTFFGSIADLLFVLDGKGNIIEVNDTVLRRLEYTKQELLGHPVLMVHPEARRAEAGATVAAMLAGTADFCPVPVLSKSGVEIQVETRVYPGIWNEEPALFGVVKDVTAVKQSEEKFSRAFQAGSNLMAISTMKTGEYMDVNELFLQSLGYSRDEVIGRTSRELDVFYDYQQRDIVKASIAENGLVRCGRKKEGRHGFFLNYLHAIDVQYDMHSLCEIL